MEPIFADSNEARRLLGGIGVSKLYQLFNRGEIEGVFLDNKRLFTIKSLKALAERLTNEAPRGINRRIGNLKYCHRETAPDARED